MSEKVVCITRGCGQTYEIDPNADSYDRNFCPDCNSRQYLSLKRLQQNTRHYAKPAGKRMRPKAKKNLKTKLRNALGYLQEKSR